MLKYVDEKKEVFILKHVTISKNNKKLVTFE